MFDFNKPKIEITELSEDKKFGRFVVETLERGYGTTLGNSLRRIMLSSLPGAAVSQVKIDGVLHEFSSIPGVKEDVSDIIMNLKSLAIKNHSTDNEPKTAYIECEGKGVVTAADIQADQDIEIMNPDQDQGKAMLFSAPSGTGKTTQAGLWEQYRGSRTVNGDKALLEYDGKAWTANGWPVCGTSEVCENKKLPIGCIVMLSQAKLNQAWRLRPAEAFTSLYGQITMNRWDREELVKNLDLLERLVGKVPIYHLACDISEDAVKTLEQELVRDSSEEAAAAAFLQKNAMRKMEKKA